MTNPRRRTLALLTAGFVLLASAALVASPAGAARDTGGGKRQMYQARVDGEQFNTLVNGGYDIAGHRVEGKRFEVDLVLSRSERDALRGEGIEVELLRTRSGRTPRQLAARQAREGYEVWRPWDGRGGIRGEMYRIARRYPAIAQLHQLGTSHQGREILAIRLTGDVRTVPPGARPAVLYQGTTHAREWISTEVTRRLLWHFIDGYDRNTNIRQILDTRELWFIPVVNPDGYQYTFEEDRLWRKNLRDNDGNGIIDSNDGVDLNRNYPEHWNYDEEGSSSQFSSETYRGPSAASEPETQANMALFEMVDFAFAISYHSYGQLLLYPQGWQIQTPSADDPIYVALTGTDEEPAVRGFDPDVSAELYITNGEFTDWAHAEEDVLAWTPELSEGCEGCGFVFPDDEELVQREFLKNLRFAMNVARSAGDPDDPASHAGIDTEGLYLDVSDIDPYKANNPLSDLTFDVSYGDPQPVEVLAKRALGPVTLHYSIDGGPTVTAGTSPSPEGEVFGGNNAYNTYYHYLRGEVTGTEPGDEVEVWFTGGGESTEHFTYSVEEEPSEDVLIVAMEDYTGTTNVPGYSSSTSPNYLSYFEDAVTRSRRTYDVYDVDGHDRTAPDHLGVLAHYDAVVWYGGNDLITRDQGMVVGSASRLANDMMLEVRSYLNEGGKVLYNGMWAGFQYAFGYAYDPVANEPCFAGQPGVDRRCLPLSDDFLQYYLGAYLYNTGAGWDSASDDPYPVVGTEAPYTGMGWQFNGPGSAQNHEEFIGGLPPTASFLTTSSLLPESEYPQFASDAPAQWDTGGGGAFEPYDGDWYVYSNRGDISYKRLTRTIDLTGVSAGDSPTLTFRFSYDTEANWDFVFVEAHTVGQDDWTTLPDQNGHTHQETGDSCAAGWVEDLHPHLAHYMNAECEPTGTTGEWHANSGRSQGWEEWQIDLSEYAGSEVEVSISYASDWAVQGLGAWVDHVEVSTEPGVESFESGLGEWTVPGPPPESDPNPNDWERTQSVGFEEGAIVSTDDTLYFGFGLEGVSRAPKRAAIMDKSLDYLGA